jgi:hypothetical protein
MPEFHIISIISFKNEFETSLINVEYVGFLENINTGNIPANAI